MNEHFVYKYYSVDTTDVASFSKPRKLLSSPVLTMHWQ
jgi:hypothetical protein